MGVFEGFGRRKKTDPKNPAANPIRRQLIELVSRRLGINEACLQRELELPRAAVRHHLRVLVQEGILTRYPLGRENHYFLPRTDARRMDRLAMANHGRAHAVLREIFLDPGIPQWQLGQRLQMTRKVLRYHLDFLTSHGLVAERRHERQQCYWPGTEADQDVRGQVESSRCLHIDAPKVPAPRRPGALPP